jgi:hypothetical protein
MCPVPTRPPGQWRACSQRSQWARPCRPRACPRAGRKTCPWPRAAYVPESALAEPLCVPASTVPTAPAATVRTVAIRRVPVSKAKKPERIFADEISGGELPSTGQSRRGRGAVRPGHRRSATASRHCFKQRPKRLNDQLKGSPVAVGRAIHIGDRDWLRLYPGAPPARGSTARSLAYQDAQKRPPGEPQPDRDRRAHPIAAGLG